MVSAAEIRLIFCVTDPAIGCMSSRIGSCIVVNKSAAIQWELKHMLCCSNSNRIEHLIVPIVPGGAGSA
jgi:hypothetical protein